MLDEAAAAHLLREPVAPGAPWRFRHSLVRDVLYSALPTSVRTGLHRAIGEALETLHGADVDRPLAELAHHYVQAAAAEIRRRRSPTPRSRLRGPPSSTHTRRPSVTSASRSRSPRTTSSAAACCSPSARPPRRPATRPRRGPRSSGPPTWRAGSGLADELARAAIGYGGRFAWLRAGDDERIVPLLEQALAALPPGDSIPRARLLARLAGALRDEPSIERRDDLSRRGARDGAPARRSGDAVLRDPRALAVDRRSRPDGRDAGPRPGAAGASRSRGTTASGCADSLWFTLIDMTTSGADATDIHAVMDEYGRLARELRQQSLQWYHGGMQTIHALAEGRLADAEALLVETRRRGQKTQTWDSDVSYRLGLFTLRREQGRLDETVDLMTRRRRALPRLPDVPEHRGIHARERRPARRRGRGSRRRRARWLRRSCPATSAGSTGWSWRWMRPRSSAIAIGPSRPRACSRPTRGGSRSRPGRSTADRSTGCWGLPPRWTGGSTRRSRTSRRPPGSRATRVCPSGSIARRWRRPRCSCGATARATGRSRSNSHRRRPTGRGRWAVSCSRPMRAGSWTTPGRLRTRAPIGAPPRPSRLPARAGRPCSVAKATSGRWAPSGSSGSGTPRGCSTSRRCSRSPGREFHALDLAGGGTADPETRAALAQASESADAGEPLDAEAKAAYRARIAELRALIDRAAPGDMDGTVERAHAELEAITARTVRRLWPRWSRTTDGVCRRASAPERQQGGHRGHRAHRCRGRGARRPPGALHSDGPLLRLRPRARAPHLRGSCEFAISQGPAAELG